MMQSHNAVIRTDSYYITFLVYWGTVLVSFPGSRLASMKNNEGVRGKPRNINVLNCDCTCEILVLFKEQEQEESYQICI